MSRLSPNASIRVGAAVYHTLRTLSPQGTGEEVAALCGVKTWELQHLSRLSRTEEWLEQHGWKIDYRGHGAKRHIPWTISSVSDGLSLNTRSSGDRCRQSAERKIRTASVDYSVYLAQTEEGTIERRKAEMISTELRHLVEKMELLAA